ncbi:MAG: YceI family protein [Flavobacteriales bacterium]|jgi:hypothetical protein|nr:YceI family protein [Flavobacteriales bacterium]
MRLVKSGFLVIFLFSLLGMPSLFAQSLQLNNEQSELNITGTSSLHDWNVNANSLSGEGLFTIKSDTLTDITKLTFFVSVDGLKGEKPGMDKKIQSALDVSKQKTIAYQFEKIIKIYTINAHTFTTETSGLLTVAGTTKKINLLLTITIENKTIRIKGEKNLKMTDFNILRPKALLGMLKTGDDVKVAFNVLYQ